MIDFAKSTGSNRDPMRLQGLISIVMPVYRETQLLPQIERLLGQDYPEFEVIVVDGLAEATSIHDLLAAKTAHPKRYQRIRACVSPAPGRGRQMNHGAHLAQGETLLFLHADTELPVGALQQISATLRQYPDCVGGAFDLGIAADQAIYRILEQVSSWRSRLTRLPYGDQALFYRREAFFELGAYPEWPLMEDVGLGQQCKRAGREICLLPMRVQTSPRRWQQEGWLYNTLRNWSLISLYLCGVAPDKLVKFYP